MPIIIIYIDQCADDASGFRSLLIVIFYSFSILTSAVIKWLISHPNNGNFFFYIFLLVLKIPFDFVGAWFQCDIIHSGRIAFSVLWFDSKKKEKKEKEAATVLVLRACVRRRFYWCAAGLRVFVTYQSTCLTLNRSSYLPLLSTFP